MFLSQPPMATKPSIPSQPTTVSMESAMTSRETSEYFMPSDPMEMPSETVMVLKMMALPPARLAPASASRANWSMCALQGVTMLQVEAMPMMRLLEILLLEADGVEHGAAGRAFRSVQNEAGVGSEAGAGGAGRCCMFSFHDVEGLKSQRPPVTSRQIQKHNEGRKMWAEK